MIAIQIAINVAKSMDTLQLPEASFIAPNTNGAINTPTVPARLMTDNAKPVVDGVSYLDGVENTTGGMHAAEKPSSMEPRTHKGFEMGIIRKTIAIANDGTINR